MASPIRVDMTGQVFTRLTVLGFAEMRGQTAYWRCVCICGTEKVVHGLGLRRGSTKSCGCLQREQFSSNGRKHATHNLSSTPEYASWAAMKDRCLNPDCEAYGFYGGRGIGICARWMDFEAFLADMGPRPKGMTLDRADNDKGYEPGNCRWATKTEQSRNRRTVKLSMELADAIRADANSATSELAARYGVSGSMIRSIRSGRAWVNAGKTIPATGSAE